MKSQPPPSHLSPLLPSPFLSLVLISPLLNFYVLMTLWLCLETIHICLASDQLSPAISSWSSPSLWNMKAWQPSQPCALFGKNLPSLLSFWNFPYWPVTQACHLSCSLASDPPKGLSRSLNFVILSLFMASRSAFSLLISTVCHFYIWSVGCCSY